MGNRTDFANYACKLLYDKYDGDFGAHDFYQQAVILRKHFEDNVRNIYELVDEIPLFLYVDYCTMYFEEGDIYNEKYEGWTNVYIDDSRRLERSFIYKSEKEAKAVGVMRKGYVATAKIEWEEQKA